MAVDQQTLFSLTRCVIVSLCAISVAFQLHVLPDALFEGDHPTWPVVVVSWSFWPVLFVTGGLMIVVDHVYVAMASLCVTVVACVVSSADVWWSNLVLETLKPILLLETMFFIVHEFNKDHIPTAFAFAFSVYFGLSHLIGFDTERTTWQFIVTAIVQCLLIVCFGLFVYMKRIQQQHIEQYEQQTTETNQLDDVASVVGLDESTPFNKPTNPTTTTTNPTTTTTQENNAIAGYLVIVFVLFTAPMVLLGMTNADYTPPEADSFLFWLNAFVLVLAIIVYTASTWRGVFRFVPYPRKDLLVGFTGLILLVLICGVNIVGLPFSELTFPIGVAVTVYIVSLPTIMCLLWVSATTLGCLCSVYESYTNKSLVVLVVLIATGWIVDGEWFLFVLFPHFPWVATIISVLNVVCVCFGLALVWFKVDVSGG